MPAMGAEIPEEIQNAVPDSAADIIQQDTSDFSAWNIGLSKLWERTCKLLAGTVQDSLGGVVLIMSAVLLCAVAEDCYAATGSKRTLNPVPFVGTLVILLAAGSNMKNLMGLGSETLEELNVFSKALLPTLSAATAASGGIVSAGMRQIATVICSDVLMSLIRGLLLPMVWTFVAVAAAGAILPVGHLDSVAQGLRKCITWMLSGSLFLFTGYLTLSGAFASSADQLTLRLTRSAIGAAIPVVGGIISDAADSVLAGAGVLKQSIGIFGTLVILSACIVPFIKLGVQYLLLKLAAFLTASVAPKPLAKLVETLGSAFGLVLAMTGAGVLLLLISIASTVSVVSV